MEWTVVREPCPENAVSVASASDISLSLTAPGSRMRALFPMSDAAQNYKDTVNLPKTDFPMKADLVTREPQRLEKWEREPEWDDRITTRVPCGEYFGVRDQALLAHATQIDPDGMWFAIPREIQQKTWPTEDYELVDSKVDTTTLEDDLFAGIPTPAP